MFQHVEAQKVVFALVGDVDGNFVIAAQIGGWEQSWDEIEANAAEGVAVGGVGLDFTTEMQLLLVDPSYIGHAAEYAVRVDRRLDIFIGKPIPLFRREKMVEPNRKQRCYR